MEYIEQSSSKQVNNNEEVKIPALKGMKVVITIISTKLEDRKLLIASTRVILEKDKQGISMRKI